nr:Zinc finger, CCHC-type [Ipomoea batatas]
MNGLRFNIQERIALAPVWTVDEAYNMALRAEELLSQATSRKQSMATPTRNTTEANSQRTTPNQNFVPSLSNNSQEAVGNNSKFQRKKGGEISSKGIAPNPYARPMTGKCFKCGEPGHRSNECRARKYVNMVEEQDEFDEEGDINEGEVEVVEEVGEHLNCVVQRLLYTTEKNNPAQRNNIFRAHCSVLGKVCKLIIDNGSCDNIVSKALVQRLGLPTEPHPKPYKLGWIKEGTSVMVMEVCHVPVSIGKSYQDTVTCEVIDMDACHILLGRPWQFDVYAIYHGRQNTYKFVWKNKKILIPPISWSVADQRKTCVVTITANWMEFIAEAKEFKTILLVVAKERDSQYFVPDELSSLLKEFSEVAPEELPDGLPPLRDIQHQIDLIPGASLPNLPHYRMNPMENEALNNIVSELLRKGFIQETEFAYNSSVHMSIGRSPFSVVYTKTPRHAVDLLHLPKVDGMHKSASNMAEQVKNVQEEVKAKLIASNAKYKAATDKKRRQQVFQVGEQVLIYLRKERYPAGTFHKLSPKKYGPFEIVRKINDNAYVVGIPDEWKTSKTFNVADIFKFYLGQELYPDKATSGTSFPQAGEYDGVHTSNTIQGT